jgi:hypothetical protein
MFGKLVGGDRRVDVRLFFVLCALRVLTSSPGVAAQPAVYLHGGIRWIGVTPLCQAVGNWTATPLFQLASLPPSLAQMCVYEWPGGAAGGGPGPTAGDFVTLFGGGATELTEDIPALLQSASFSQEQVAFFAGLRTALRTQVGDASLLPSMPASPATRIVVIDSAPTAPAGQIKPGASRHGDTLAHLIEDLVCLPLPSGSSVCAAEVTTVLAMEGGIGTLSDLARAIEWAVVRWQNDRQDAASSAPAHLLLNLSLGWEDTPGIADCSTEPLEHLTPPARAVRGMLQYAASIGALIVAAAGNDPGGPAPREGLVCPGRYQAVPADGSETRSLVVAVSGLDYQDRPLLTARRRGITGIAGLGLGGVAWIPADPVPPQLTGSSVATAVVSAVSALVWAYQPTWTPGEITRVVYDGGVEVGTAMANECPLSLPVCNFSHRASVCGALKAANASLTCSPAAANAWSCPSLTAEISALHITAGLTQSITYPPPATLPRDSVPTPQLQPWIGPMPVAPPCPVCVLANGQLSIPPRDQDLYNAVVVVHLTDHTEQKFALDLQIQAATAAWYPLSLLLGSAPIESVYITSTDALSSPKYSITEQIFVQP